MHFEDMIVAVEFATAGALFLDFSFSPVHPVPVTLVIRETLKLAVADGAGIEDDRCVVWVGM